LSTERADANQFYITINPVDVFIPVTKFIAGSGIDIDKLLPEDIPDYWDQSVLIAKNPVITTQFSYHTFQ
jgi:hypothetical protein